MINLLCTFRRDDHPIRLNQEFHRDLTWWRELFQSWDGLSFFFMPAWAPLPDLQVSSDAAGSLGFGAIFNIQWFLGEWAVSQQPLSLAYKELFPIVVAAHLWGSQWSTRRVEFLCVSGGCFVFGHLQRCRLNGFLALLGTAGSAPFLFF